MIQTEKMEKERIYTSLANENEKVTRDIERINSDNLEKELNIQTLTKDVADQKAAIAEMTLELEKRRKKSKSIFCCG